MTQDFAVPDDRLILAEGETRIRQRLLLVALGKRPADRAPRAYPANRPAVGVSRSGRTTKIHALADEHGRFYALSYSMALAIIASVLSRIAHSPKG